MLSSKDRALVRSIISNDAPVCFVGKDGLSDSVLDSINVALTSREGIKISILQNCDEDLRSIMESICSSLSAEPIGVVGRKLMIYRYNPDAKKHLFD